MVLTRSHIARTLSNEIGLTRKNSVEVINAFTRAITKGLEAGEEVRIRSFGRFMAIPDGGRGRKGFSGNESLPRTARKVVRFKCSKILKACLQGEAGACEGVSGVNAIIEHLQKNIGISGQLQNVLNAHCRWVDSEGSKGKRANLARFDMRGADLFGANLRSANLSRASLANADLSDCDIETADLENADLKGASLAWANIRDANLRGACLIEADLRWADLRRANLSEADFRGANLSGADLRDAILMGADFRGAKLKSTILEKRNSFSPAALKLKFKNNLKL
jgi:uncharacterized protein YjbI with pentapeptide repeats